MSYLAEQGQAVANANGDAQVILAPGRAFESWQVTGMVITVTGTGIAHADVYRNHVSSGSRLDSSRRANDDRSETNLRVRNGERLICVFNSADVGASCTFAIEGETVKGRT